MKAISPLKDVLKTNLKWNQARIDFLSKFIVTLIRKESVNLKKIAKAFPGKAKVDSHYRRLSRFFEKYTFDFSVIALMLTALFDLPEKWTLCLDRSNWKFGKFNINILMLSVAHQGIAIPVMWVLLPKRGNSNKSERTELLSRFVELFGNEKIDCLTADREFIGEGWLKWLKDQKIRFCIRVRKNLKTTNSRGSEIRPIYHLFRGLKLGESMILRKIKPVTGVKVHLIGLRVKGDWIFLITDHDPYQALEKYKMRWQIETLFGCLKTRGFNLEDTHLNQMDRVSKMVALLSIAFCWAYRIGIYMNEKKVIAIKKHGRKSISLFRYGLDWLIQTLFNLTDHKKDFRLAVQFLSST